MFPTDPHIFPIYHPVRDVASPTNGNATEVGGLLLGHRGHRELLPAAPLLRLRKAPAAGRPWDVGRVGGFRRTRGPSEASLSAFFWGGSEGFPFISFPLVGGGLQIQIQILTTNPDSGPGVHLA